MSVHTNAADPLLDVQRVITLNVRRRFGGYRSHDQEDAVSVGVMAVLCYWVPKYGAVTAANAELAATFGIRRAAEAFCGELDRQEQERVWAGQGEDDDEQAGWLERAAEAAQRRAGEDVCNVAARRR